MAKIGIFGGSFNPPHLGHILAVREFHDKLALERVLLIPSAIPPHKRFPENSPEASHRLQMTELAVSDLPYAEVLDLELRRPGASYTADTVDELKRQYPNDDLYLLMGTDMFLTFELWYQPERIAGAVTLAVAYRDGESDLSACAMKLRSRFDAKIVFLKNEYLPYSSTSVRAMIAFDCAEKYLASAVLSYIRENQLYYCGADLKNLPFDRLAAVSLSLHKAERVAHVVGCSETAECLARKYGENTVDAKRAGILHDVTKALKADEQLTLCERYAIALNPFERENPKLLHARTGAAVAREIFGENDAVYEAIYWHTTGKSDMTCMEKILYMADYIEPNRSFDGVEELRRLAKVDLDGAMLLGIQMTVGQLTARGRQIDPNSLGALRFFKERKQTT